MPKLVGFSPDLDPRTPGIFLDCNNVIPTMKGFKPIEKLAQHVTGLPDAAQGTFLARFLDGSFKLYVGTVDALYRRDGTSWTDVSGGQTFSLGPEDRWRFAVFGNDVLATWRSRSGVAPGADDVPQIASGPSGTFGKLGGSPPRGMFVETVNNFVFLLNTDNKENEYATSGIGAVSTWTPDIATQAVRDGLDETDGEIVGAKRLGTELVVYRFRSMYALRYVGPPVIWGAALLSSEVGALNHEAVVDVGNMHVFPSLQDFYTYSGGARPQLLQTPLREFFFRDDLDFQYSHKTLGRWDRKNDVVFWHYVSKNTAVAGQIDKWLAWHRQVNYWTRGDLVIEDVALPELEGVGAMTYDEFSDTYVTYDSPELLTITYDDPAFGSSFRPAQGVFLTDHVLYSYTGPGDDATILTGDYGDDFKFSSLIRVKPIFSDYPATPAQITNVNRYMTNLGDTITDGATRALHKQGWFNNRRAARYHRFLMSLTGDWEMLQFEPIFREAGVR